MAIKPGIMRNIVPKKGREIKSIPEAMQYVDYRMFFSDKAGIEYLNSFKGRFSRAKTDSDRKSLILEADNLTTLYCLMVYYLYPGNPKFRDAIINSKEFSANFVSIKNWLDSQGGKGIADKFVKFASG